MKSAYWQASLDQLLAEPITRLLMRRDGVSEDQIRRLIARTARRRSTTGRTRA